MSPRSTAAFGEVRRPEPRPFCSVAETAQMLGTSEMTVYRAIAAGEFPAVRIRGRIIVPRQAIEAMTAAAMGGGGTVDVSDCVPDSTNHAERQVHVNNRTHTNTHPG
jgi:excisionase family DNA binding protein